MRKFLRWTAPVVVAFTLMSSAGAATGTLVFTDLASDANGLNGQGEKGFGAIGVPTGNVNVAEADIRLVKMRPVYRRRLGERVRNGFVVKVVTTGVPGGRAQYWLDGRIDKRCDRVVIVHHPGSVTSQRHTEISFNCNGRVQSATLPAATVKGTTLSIRVPDKVLPKWLRARHDLSDIWLETRSSQGLANVLDTAQARGTFPLR
jgi:hypothetical protein